MWSKTVLSGPVCKMLLIVPKVNYFLNPTEIELQIPSSEAKKGRDYW